jgi:hypothetical protein
LSSISLASDHVPRASCLLTPTRLLERAFLINHSSAA